MGPEPGPGSSGGGSGYRDGRRWGPGAGGPGPEDLARLVTSVVCPGRARRRRRGPGHGGPAGGPPPPVPRLGAAAGLGTVTVTVAAGRGSVADEGLGPDPEDCQWVPP